MNEQNSGRARGQSAAASSVVARRRTGPMESGSQVGPPIPTSAEGADIPVLFRLPQVGARPAVNAGRTRGSSPANATNNSAHTTSASPQTPTASATKSPVESPTPVTVAPAKAERDADVTVRSTDHWFGRLAALRGVTMQWFIVGVVAVLVVGGVAVWRNQGDPSKGPKERDRTPLVLNIDEGAEAGDPQEPKDLHADSDGPVARMASRIDESSKPSTARSGGAGNQRTDRPRDGAGDAESGPQLDLQPPLMSPPSDSEPERRPSAGTSSLAPPMPATSAASNDSGAGGLTSETDEPIPPQPTSPDGAAMPDMSSGTDASSAPYPRTNPTTYLYRDDSPTTVARRNDDTSTDSRGTR